MKRNARIASRSWILSLLGMLSTACGSSNAELDATVPDTLVFDAGTDAPSSDIGIDASPSDAGPDVLDDGGAPDAGVDSGPPTRLPITGDQVLSVNTTAGLDIYTALLPANDGGLLVFEHYDDDVLSGGALWAVQVRGTTIEGAPFSIDFGSVPTIRASPSHVRIGEVHYLYYVESDALRGRSNVYRRVWDGEGFGAEQTVTLPEATSLLSWPSFHQMESGEVVVAYRDDFSEVKLSTSADGLTFGPSETLGPPGAQPAAGDMSSGTRVFTYQDDSSGTIIASFRVRTESWSEPRPVTESSTNVHDTDIYRRLDGRSDLYYIYPDSAVGFALWRRCLDSDGTLGTEEKVVVSDWGNLAKPRAHRLPSGGTLLSFVDQNSGHLLSATFLVGDAPCR